MASDRLTCHFLIDTKYDVMCTMFTILFSSILEVTRSANTKGQFWKDGRIISDMLISSVSLPLSVSPLRKPVEKVFLRMHTTQTFLSHSRLFTCSAIRWAWFFHLNRYFRFISNGTAMIYNFISIGTFPGTAFDLQFIVGDWMLSKSSSKFMSALFKFNQIIIWNQPTQKIAAVHTKFSWSCFF